MRIFDEEAFLKKLVSYDNSGFMNVLEKTGMAVEETQPFSFTEDIALLCGRFMDFMKAEMSVEVDFSEEELLTLAEKLDEITSFVDDGGTSFGLFERMFQNVRSNTKKRRVL